ncbi:hypothetical protein Y032_0004g1950 [Ancylostoma ceylanicum]|uniref:Uncharacterized protein n=1 Tax=Ancylostoma ceylanicum TaxID=53326 RepID=A0A016VUW4_9BILA|nr:hypothetical protein Y032_0004g1950 [Ancylostoma ceylanicum]
MPGVQLKELDGINPLTILPLLAFQPLDFERKFSEKVYTNVKTSGGQCGAELQVGSRYILKGIVRICALIDLTLLEYDFAGVFGEGAKPMVTSCGVLEICSRSSEKNN